MKKSFGTLLISVLLISLFFPILVSANPAPGGPFTSTIRLQNMGDDAASVVLKFIDSSGAEAYVTPSQTVAVDDVLIIYTPSLSSLASGEYSVVIESSQPLAAATSFSDADSSAAYTGFVQGSLSWFLPGLYDDYYSYYSNVYTQNLSSAAVDITLDIFAPNNPVPVYSDTKTNVPTNTTVKWDQAGLAELAKNVAYSGTITATGDVAPIINIYGSGTAGKQLYSYNGFMSGGTKWFTPVLMKNYYGWNAAIAIQNVSPSEANVTVKYSTGYSKSYNIQPNSAITIYVPNESPLPSGKNGIFSAEITSNIDVVVMVNESNTYNRAATYNGFSSSSTKVYIPTIMKQVSNFSTSVTCQNIGTIQTRMQIEYFGQPAAGSTSNYVQAGGTYLWYQPNSTLPNGYDGSAIVTSLEGVDIACIINQNMEEAPYFTMSMDMLSSYNGVSE